MSSGRVVRGAWRGCRPWALVLMALWLAGCATGLPVGMRVEAGAPRHRPSVPRALPKVEKARTSKAGGRGVVVRKDAFAVLQEAAGLEQEARQQVGQALAPGDVRRLWEALARPPATLRSFGPRLTLGYLLREARSEGSPVEYAELLRRLERFGPLVVVRPDGYLTGCITGKPLQKVDAVRLEEGRLLAGRLEVGTYYHSSFGVLFPVDAQLRKVAGSEPLGELALEKDWVNAALDGVEDALGETARAIAQTVAHPIRTVEGLGQLPSAVATLIASSPEYFAHYGTLPLREQVREAARLSTHLMLLYGSAAGATSRIPATGARLPVLSLSADGRLAVETVAVPTGRWVVPIGAGVGAVYVVAQQGGAGGGEGPPPGPVREPGDWGPSEETLASAGEAAAKYQRQVTGHPVEESYWVGGVGRKSGGVKFDGYKDGVLLECKGPGYDVFFRDDLEPVSWFMETGARDMLAQADRQLRTANGVPVHWHVAEAKAAKAIRVLLRNGGYGRIKVVHTPARP